MVDDSFVSFKSKTHVIPWGSAAEYDDLHTNELRLPPLRRFAIRAAHTHYRFPLHFSYIDVQHRPH